MLSYKKREGLLISISLWLMALIIVVFFSWFLGDIIINSRGKISWQFLFSQPLNAGREGGIAPILVSTFLILFVTMVTALPLGVGTAIFLTEFTEQNNFLGVLIRRSLDILAGVPSIVFGLFGNAFFTIKLGLGFSILSGGLTLACMVLPILIRTTEEGLRNVPLDYRLGAAALGISQRATLWRIVLPSAVGSVIVGFVLGVGRAIAETAALIFTSGYVDRMPESLMDSGRSLSIHIFDLSMNVSGGDDNAYGSALVLLMLFFLINFIAKIILNVTSIAHNKNV
ncbi:phosphate ABC transporter permease PstA [Cyanobacterium stanieri LEGE 03274]|uniref:Phosphate transport system permease protein PstA n=1 Tax=Cyanobacterium stanieri LEGE 03274 TaxID=1828756 RepID=A0ABR9V5X5_9CHRO|nr:phosphate ABC transporter permease PstA [Cyanobacterium stanieri]MBE9222531.1 phosphate ABC transporter permease PstA [Cyanobacterium stanieri LEGE 03274]